MAQWSYQRKNILDEGSTFLSGVNRVEFEKKRGNPEIIKSLKKTLNTYILADGTEAMALERANGITSIKRRA